MSGKVVVVPFQVINPFPGLEHIFGTEGDADHGGILLGVFIRTFCKRAEFADVHAVGKGMDVLEDHGQFSLAFPFEGIDLEGTEGHHPEFRCRGISTQVTGTAVGGGIADAHAFETTRVISRDGLAFDRHRDFPVTKGFRSTGCTFGKLVPDSFALGDLVHQGHHSFSVTPFQASAIGVTFLTGFLVDRDDITHFDGVESIIVALVDQFGDGVTSLFPQLAPNAQEDSYSNDSMRSPFQGPSLISTSFLQAVGQA